MNADNANLKTSSDPVLSAFIRGQFLFSVPPLENQPGLKLKHPWWVDVGKRRDRIRCSSHAHQLSKRAYRCLRIAVGGHPAAEEIAMVEKIEALDSQQ